MDMNKKVSLINKIRNFSRISRGLFFKSIALFMEYLVHRRVNAKIWPIKQEKIPFINQIWKHEAEKLCFRCFHDFPLMCSNKGAIRCFFWGLVRVCVYFLSPERLLLTEQNVKCNSRVQVSDYMLRKIYCIKYLCRHVMDNHSRIFKLATLKKVSSKTGESHEKQLL